MNSGIFNAAVLTVCVDPVVADQIVNAVEQMPWLVTASAFETYISAVRRPYFSPNVKVANAIIAIVDFDGDVDQAVETTKYLHQSFPGKVTVIALAKASDPTLFALGHARGLQRISLQAL